MKKLLLSFICCFMASASLLAEEKTINITISEFTPGTQYAQNEEHVLSNELTIYTTKCHFTTELRIYSSNTNNGNVVSNQLPGAITRMTFNAGKNKDNLVVYGSNNGESWVEIGKITTATSYKDYTIDFPQDSSYKYFKLDVEGTNAVWIKKMSVTYTQEGASEPEEPVTTIDDTLNRDFTGVTGSNYKEWAGKTAPSTGVYAGSTAGDNGAIQLRSTNHSGIITTKSGGKAKRIVIEWNENTDTVSVRKISIYGKNSAYTTPAELYANATQGEKLAELVYGTTEFTLTGEYKYIGLRSYSKTIYLNSIKITWEEDESTSQPYILNVSEVGYATLMLGYNAVIPTGVEAYIVSKTSGNYATLTKITTNILPANEAVIIKANAGTYEFAQTADESTIEGNLLMGTLSDIEVEADAYVLSKPAGEELGLYMATKNKKNNTAFLNNASKAYLPINTSEKANLSTSLRFEFSGTTAIEEVEGNSEDAEIIYDLAGRRIERITEPGIYIIGGKKRVVK